MCRILVFNSFSMLSIASVFDLFRCLIIVIWWISLIIDMHLMIMLLPFILSWTFIDSEISVLYFPSIVLVFICMIDLLLSVVHLNGQRVTYTTQYSRPFVSFILLRLSSFMIVDSFCNLEYRLQFFFNITSLVYSLSNVISDSCTVF
jgi:hypothetical protein